MDLNFTPEELAFRQEIRTWVAANLPTDLSRKVLGAMRLSRSSLCRICSIMNGGSIARSLPPSRVRTLQTDSKPRENKQARCQFDAL
ncbi:MAG: Acyl-CoA dehydrogenase [Pseudomonadota bacterium]